MILLTGIHNKEGLSCIWSISELCPARDRRLIKNVPLQNEAIRQQRRSRTVFPVSSPATNLEPRGSLRHLSRRRLKRHTEIIYHQ